MVASRTKEASAADATGSTNAWPSLRAERAMASAPRTGRRSPVSANSPANSYCASWFEGIWPVAARMPSAMGRSKRPDSLRRSAGARLTVTFRAGHSKREFCIAARTRSRASRTSASGRPTRWIPGNPPAICTSTATRGAATPASARLCRIATDIAAWRDRFRVPRRRFLVGRRRPETRFQFGDAGLEALELLARFGEHRSLRVEFFPRHEIEARETALEYGLDVFFDVAGRARFDRLADSRGQLGEHLGVESLHRRISQTA